MRERRKKVFGGENWNMRWKWKRNVWVKRICEKQVKREERKKGRLGIF
jgi:hypothetical protein